MAIRSVTDKRTRDFIAGKRVKAFSGFARQAYKRLEILNAAPTLDVLAALPGNRLESLRGNRHGQHSIRINDQWRICFRWGKNGPEDIEIVDYH